MRTRTTLIALAAAVTLGACVQSAPPPATVPKPSPSPGLSPDYVFMTAVRTEFPDAIDADTIHLGHTYCGLLDSGVPLERIVKSGTANPYLAGFVAGAAIVAYCPAHSDQL